MKKILLIILVINTLSCSDDNNKKQTDPIVGKWLIYKAQYGNTIYNFEINNQCAQQALEMQDNYSQYMSETIYTNDDCTTYKLNTDWQWRKESEGIYSIYFLNMSVPERTVVLTENEIEVTTPGQITIIKHYRKAL